jgi:hypothetical protein
MQHGHGQAAKSWTCSMDLDMHRGHGHAAWTCIMDTVMQHGQGHNLWTGHAAWQK